jgi:outer membrane beta-barrel protein
MNRNLIGVCVVMSVVAVSTAKAQEADSGDLVEKVAVRNRLFNVDHRWELGGNFGLSLLSRLTDHYNLNLSGAYNITDWFAVEARAGYAISRHTGLANQVRDEYLANLPADPLPATDLSDLWQMTFNSLVGVRFQPIYGKLGLMAELPVHFQLYGWLGAGFGMFHRDSLVICVQKTGNHSCASYLSENKPGPLLSAALGFRFFVNEKHSIKIEARDFSFLDSYYQNINLNQASAACLQAKTCGQPSPNAGITNLVQLDLGYSFLF